MAKRYKLREENESSNAGTLNESTLKKIKSVFSNEMMYLTRSGIAQDVREKVFSLDSETLRRIGREFSIANMCINCREQQVAPFLKQSRNIGYPGYVIIKNDSMDLRRGNKVKDKRAKEIAKMIDQTGYMYDPTREDDFIDFGKMMVREVYTIDQVAIELQRNRKEDLAAFWLLDGGTIFRTFQSRGFQGNTDIKFVQLIENEVKAAYTDDDIIFDYMYKRADIKYRGWGYPVLEQAIDLVTTLILGISYNRDMFIKDKIPKGFLALSGEADDETIQALERYWFMAMSGAGARFKIPILPTGKEGVGIDFKTLNQSNKDIEYHKLMLFFLSLFTAVFGLDLAELGIRTDNTATLSAENISGRQEYSKDRGLRAILSFIETIMNKIVRKIDENYSFMFVGIDPEDELNKYKIHGEAVKSTRTINEMRGEDGLDPLEGDEYNMVLDQIVAQVYMARKQQEQQEQQDMNADEFDSTADGGNGGQYEISPEDMEPEDQMNKAINELEEHLENLKKSGYEVDIKL